jgi:hypothetical protein
VFSASAALHPPSFTPSGGHVHSPALVTIINPNPTGAVFYTFDGGDPRGPFGNVGTNARRLSGPGLQLECLSFGLSRRATGDLFVAGVTGINFSLQVGCRESRVRKKA